MTDTHFLKTIFNEQNFKMEDLEKILSQYQRKEFAKNDYLIKEGEIANFYYFILNYHFLKIPLHPRLTRRNIPDPSEFTHIWH